MQLIEKSLYQTWLAAAANRKVAPVRFFVKIICATPTVSLFHQLFYFYYLQAAPHKRLVLFN